MSMTPEQQLVAIKEWMGWKHSFDGIANWWEKDDVRVKGVDGLPDVLNDLNAVFACQDKLTNEQVNVYVQHLLGSYFGSDLIGPCFRCATATVSQRCEALCRTLWPDRWKEAQ